LSTTYLTTREISKAAQQSPMGKDHSFSNTKSCGGVDAPNVTVSWRDGKICQARRNRFLVDPAAGSMRSATPHGHQSNPEEKKTDEKGVKVEQSASKTFK